MLHEEQQPKDEFEEKLLKTKLTQDEVRVLLDRLQSYDSAASNLPTVEAMVEATGEDPYKISQLLAEIRQEAAAKVAQAPQTIYVERRKISPVLMIAAALIAMVIAFLVIGTFSVRPMETKTISPTVEHDAVRTQPTGTPAPPAPKVPGN